MSRTQSNPQKSLPFLEPKAGRDEMNLAEFPLVLLSKSVPRNKQAQPTKHAQTLVFTYPHGKLVITGAALYGLPTAADADVLVGLIQLTRVRNQFQDTKVFFSRYELLKLLRWPDEGRSYQRIDDSLNRWMGVLVNYQNSWWDNESKRFLTKKFHILETVHYEESAKRTKQLDRLRSYFVWNRAFIESCQADNLKRLDLDLYFRFKSAVTKRMYRFLDKRFYKAPDWTFDLKEFAFEYIGLSRSYEKNSGKIKEKLEPALQELEQVGYIEPMARDQRYRKQGGGWTIRIVSKRPMAGNRLGEDSENDRPRIQALTDRGVTEASAQEIVVNYPADRIDRQIDILDWIMTAKPQQVQDPGAWLPRAIRDDYAPPKGYQSKADRQSKDQQKAKANREAARARNRQKQEQIQKKTLDDAIAKHWDELTAEQQAQVDADALAAADPEIVAAYEAMSPPSLQTIYFRNAIRSPYLKRQVTENCVETS